MLPEFEKPFALPENLVYLSLGVLRGVFQEQCLSDEGDSYLAQAPWGAGGCSSGLRHDPLSLLPHCVLRLQTFMIVHMFAFEVDIEQPGCCLPLYPETPLIILVKDC